MADKSLKLTHLLSLLLVYGLLSVAAFYVAPANAERLYGSDGKYIGRIENNRLYDRRGRYQGRIEGDRLYNERGERWGRFEYDVLVNDRDQVEAVRFSERFYRMHRGYRPDEYDFEEDW